MTHTKKLLGLGIATATTIVLLPVRDVLAQTTLARSAGETSFRSRHHQIGGPECGSQEPSGASEPDSAFDREHVAVVADLYRLR